MTYAWILDVLDDLRSFAAANGLPDLAERLDDASLLAAEEIAQLSEKPPARQTEAHAQTARTRHRGIAAHDNA
ncbi:hypothetical protein [Ostreiculturibacter nitratireducens]|uniref:hypothetical protein n=1 Tax=Ostreiculturibacter nitratireducens TaxID=3075226 RepID=UPI0031B58A4C